MVAKSSERQARSSSAASLFLFYALAFAVMWTLFFAVAFIPIPAGSSRAGERRPSWTPFSQLSFLTRSCAIYTSQGRDAAFRSSSCARGRSRHFGELGG